MVSVSLIRTGAKCEIGPWYSRPKIRAKNRADASLSRAGTIVWSRTMVKSASSFLIFNKNAPDCRNRQAPPAQDARHSGADWEREFATSVCSKRNRDRYPTEPVRMNHRAPINALTFVFAGLLLTTGAPAHAQTTDKASMA